MNLRDVVMRGFGKGGPVVWESGNGLEDLNKQLANGGGGGVTWMHTFPPTADEDEKEPTEPLIRTLRLSPALFHALSPDKKLAMMNNMVSGTMSAKALAWCEHHCNYFWVVLRDDAGNRLLFLDQTDLTAFLLANK